MKRLTLSILELVFRVAELLVVVSGMLLLLLR